MKRLLLTLAAAGLFAQTPPDCPSPDGVSRYCVILTIKNGVTARLSSILNPGVNRFPANTKADLDAYLDKALPLLGRPYRMILLEKDQKLDDAGTLSDPNRTLLINANLSLADYSVPLQAWCDSYPDCLGSAGFVLGPAGLYREFSHYQDAPLIFDPGSDLFDAETGIAVFRLPPPFDSEKVPISIPGLTAQKQAQRVAALRRWMKHSSLNGGPLLRDPVVKELTAFYDGLGLAPEVSVSFDGPQPSISILEGARVGNISFPFGVPVKDGTPDRRKTELALYGVLRDSDFRQGYLPNREALAKRLDTEQTPVLSLQSDLKVEPQRLPYVSKFRMPVQQLLLQQSGFALTVSSTIRRLLKVPVPNGTPVDTEFALLDLRLEDISQTPPEDAKPPAAPPPTGAMGQVDPHQAETAPPMTMIQPPPTRSLDAANYCRDFTAIPKPKHRYAGVGGQWVPGQRLKAFALFQESELPVPGMDAALSVRAGTGGGSTALANASFSAEDVLFDRIHHRLNLSFSGGQDALANRFLLGEKLDEHRRGGMGRAEFEWFRDRQGHLLKIYAEGHHDTVQLSKGDTDRLRQNLTAFDFGAVHFYQSSENPYPWTLRVEPVIRVAPGGFNADQFVRASVAARFQHALPGRFGLYFAGRFQQASDNTPEFELPSLGGADSVRGFRSDDALGQRLWSLQNELRTPVPFVQKIEFARDNLRLATFFDAGNAYRQGTINPGVRTGTGLGGRMIYGPVELSADVAYGFGQAASNSRRIKFYFGATINLPM